MLNYNKVIFELSEPGRVGYSLPDNPITNYSIDPAMQPANFFFNPS